MNKKTMLICIFLSVFLVSCGNQSTDTSSTIKPNTSESLTETNSKAEQQQITAGKMYDDGYPDYDFSTRYDKIQDTYPDKEIIIWATDCPERYEENFNEYLNNNDYNYVVCFKDYSYNEDEMIDENGQWCSSYSEMIKEDLENKEQIDIISTGDRYQGYDSFVNAYQYFSESGWLEPLDNYLTETDLGKEITSQMGKNSLDGLIIDNNIYGLDGTYSCLNSSVGFSFNSTLFDKLGIDTKAISDTYSEALTDIFDICKSNNLQFAVRYLESMKMYTDFDFLTSCVYINNDGKASNIYESDEVKSIFKAIENGYEHNCIDINNSCSLSNYLGECTLGTNGSYSRDEVKTNGYFGLSKGMETVPAYFVYPVHNKTIHSTTQAIGVCSQSQNKELAFEALSTVMTNKDLINLICYGTEYSVVDGLVKTDGYYSILNPENMLIRSPLEGIQNKNMNDNLSEALNTSKMSAYANFVFDTSDLEKQILKTDNVIKLIEGDFPSEDNKNADDYITQLNQNLYDAGLQEIIDEANRQLDEYRKVAGK